MRIKLFESFRKMIYFELIFVSMIVTSILGYLWIDSEYTTFNQQSENEKQNFIN